MRLFRRRHPPPKVNDADRALRRAHDALRKSDEELAQVLSETRKISRELEVNHFGHLIFEDMMKRRHR